MILVGAVLCGRPIIEIGIPMMGINKKGYKRRRAITKNRPCSSPYGNRTRVTGMKILRPDP